VSENLTGVRKIIWILRNFAPVTLWDQGGNWWMQLQLDDGD